MSLERSPTQHILTLAPNQLGKDFGIGDLHGEINVFEAILQLTKLNDENNLSPNRLISVGDLGDKGKHSLEVYQRIFAINAKAKELYNRPAIYVTLGNHEKFILDFDEHLNAFINYIAISKDEALLKLKELFDGHFDNVIFKNENHWYSSSQTEITLAKNLLANIFKLFNLSMKDTKQAHTFDKLYCFTRLLLHPHSGGSWFYNLMLIKDTRGQAQTIVDYLKSLPYVIYGTGPRDKRYILIHADLNFNEEELIEKLKNKNFKFSNDDIKYLTSVVAKDFIEDKVPLTHPIKQVGHTIQGGVNESRGLINLDSGSFSFRTFYLSNLTQNKIDVFRINNQNKIINLQTEYSHLVALLQNKDSNSDINFLYVETILKIIENKNKANDFLNRKLEAIQALMRNEEKNVMADNQSTANENKIHKDMDVSTDNKREPDSTNSNINNSNFNIEKINDKSPFKMFGGKRKLNEKNNKENINENNTYKKSMHFVSKLS